MARTIIKKLPQPTAIVGWGIIKYIVICCYPDDGNEYSLPTIIAYSHDYRSARSQFINCRVQWDAMDGYHQSQERERCAPALGITNWREFSNKVLNS